MRLDWIPLFTSIVDSTLWEEPPHVRLMFLTMMFMKDPGDHIVREPLRRVAKVANLSEDKEEAYRLAEEAIRILCEPDLRTRERQAYQGRRLKWVEGQGWLVLNGEYYEKLRKELGARIRKTQLQRKRREAKKKGPMPGEALALRTGITPHEHLNGEVEPGLEERKEAEEQRGYDPDEAF